MSMITRKGTIVRKSRISRAHPSARRPVTGSLRGGHFGIITSTTAAGCSGTSNQQTTASSTVPPHLRHQYPPRYGRQSINSSQHPNCSNSDQQASTSRPSLFNTLVQLKAYEEKDLGCGGGCGRVGDGSLSAAVAGDVSAGCSMAPRASTVFAHLRQHQSYRETDPRGAAGAGAGDAGGGGGCCELIDKTTERASNTSIVAVMLGVFMTVPVGMASIGVKHLDDCPIQPKIPVYLLVGGCFGLLKLLSVLWQQVKFRRYKTKDEIDYDAEDTSGGVIVSKSSQFSEILLCLFLFVWFLCGNYWVLGVWRPNFDQVLTDPNNWCDKTVYLFAFIQIVVSYALLVAVAIATLLVPLFRRSESQKT